MENDVLYDDDHEMQNAHFLCFIVNENIYDFWIFSSGKFFGKSIVYSLQKGKVLILSGEDLMNEENLSSLGVYKDDEQDVVNYLKGALESGYSQGLQYHEFRLSGGK